VSYLIGEDKMYKATWLVGHDLGTGHNEFDGPQTSIIIQYNELQKFRNETFHFTGCSTIYMFNTPCVWQLHPIS